MADKSGLQLRNLLSLHRLTVPDSLTSAVRQECDALCNDSCPNLWLPEAAIHGKASCAIQILISRIHLELMATRATTSLAGVEIWAQVRSCVTFQLSWTAL
jgi:hypothetical protein